MGPREGPKGQISFIINYKVNFKDFLYQTVCVFSQIKDTKHIKRDLHHVALVMPQGWDFWALGAQGGFAMAPHRLCILVPICSQCIEGKQKQGS